MYHLVTAELQLQLQRSQFACCATTASDMLCQTLTMADHPFSATRSHACSSFFRYFDMRSKALPIECAPPISSSAARDCDNAEVSAPDLVITKIVLEIDNRVGEYGRCNICVNGSDHHGTVLCCAVLCCCLLLCRLILSSEATDTQPRTMPRFRLLGPN